MDSSFLTPKISVKFWRHQPYGGAK